MYNLILHVIVWRKYLIVCYDIKDLVVAGYICSIMACVCYVLSPWCSFINVFYLPPILSFITITPPPPQEGVNQECQLSKWHFTYLGCHFQSHTPLQSVLLNSCPTDIWIIYVEVFLILLKPGTCIREGNEIVSILSMSYFIDLIKAYFFLMIDTFYVYFRK